MTDLEVTRRQLAHAKRLIRDLMTAHTADMESYEEADCYALKAWARAEKFLGRR